MADLIPYSAFYPKEAAGFSKDEVPLSASRLYDYPGTLREGCIEVNGWNAYKCEGGKQRRITFESLDADGAIIWSKFLSSTDAVRMEYPDYAETLVKRIVKNVEEGNEYDDISSLQVW